jgi:hypothetical protein
MFAELKGAVGQGAAVPLRLPDDFLRIYAGLLGLDIGDRCSVQEEEIVSRSGIRGVFLDGIGWRAVAGQPPVVRYDPPACGGELWVNELFASLALRGHVAKSPKCGLLLSIVAGMSE